MPTKQQIITAYATGQIKDEQSLKFFLLMDEVKHLNISKDIERKIDAFLNQIKIVQGADGHTPTDQELLDIIMPLIPNVRDGLNGKDGIDGNTPTQAELLALIRPLVPKVEEIIRNIKIPGAEEIALKVKVPTEEEIVKKVGENLPRLGEPIRDGLELLEGEDRLDKTAIKGLEDYEEVAELAKKTKMYMGFGGGGAAQVSDFERIDLSSQCNSVLQTFSLGRVVNKVLIVLLNGSEPSFTSTTTTITLSTATPDSGEKLIALVV